MFSRKFNGKTLEDFHSELRNEILVEAESSNELT